jgi:GNAT superfamily N-acetyltransferase
LNEEWPKNFHLRCSNLEQLINTDSEALSLPISLILIDLQDMNNKKVIGHGSIISIATHLNNKTVNLPFLQSIIIDKTLRGLGLGKKLMLLCEKYFIEYSCQQKRTKIEKNLIDSFDFLYLNTKDKQKFYETLGYVEIEPLMFVANKPNSKCSEIAKSLFKSMPINSTQITSQFKANNEQNKKNTIGQAMPSPPPPPSFSKQSNSESIANNNLGKLTWFIKKIN